MDVLFNATFLAIRLLGSGLGGIAPNLGEGECPVLTTLIFATCHEGRRYSFALQVLKPLLSMSGHTPEKQPVLLALHN